MPTVLQANDIIVCRAWCTAEEQAAVNSFFFNVDSVLVATTDEEVANEFDTLVGANYRNLLSTQCRYNGIQCQIIDRGFPTALFPSAAYTGGAGPGVVAPPDLPRQTSGLISWTTPFAGRKFRGRTYMPFPNSLQDTGTGIPTSGYIGVLSTIASDINTFIGGITLGVNITQVLYHRNFPHAEPPIPPSDTPITGFRVSAKWATQRRRGSFGRANVSPI